MNKEYWAAVLEESRRLAPKPILPTVRKTLRLLRALQVGERLTVAEALYRYGIFALSQECGRLRKLGWRIQSRRIQTSPTVRVCEYWLE